MAQTIKLKRSAVAAKEPGTGDLALGELAINTYDGKMYFKKDVSGTQSIIQLANNNEVVKLTGDQTNIAGVKQFVNNVAVKGAVFTATDVNVNLNNNYVLIDLNGIYCKGGKVGQDGTPSANTDLVPLGYLNTQLATKANDNAVVKLTGTQEVAGVKKFETLQAGKTSSGSYLVSLSSSDGLGNVTADQVSLNNLYGNSFSGKIYFRSTPEATSGGKIVFGAEFGPPFAPQAGVYGSIENLKVPTTDYEAANKKYVDDEIDNHNHSLASLTGVSITSPTSGQVLKYNGANWINDTDATGGGSTNVSTDTIWDAKGDLAVGTGADTASKLTVGANGTILMADSSQTTGVKWASMPSSFDFGTIITPADFTLDLGTI